MNINPIPPLYYYYLFIYFQNLNMKLILKVNFLIQFHSQYFHLKLINFEIILLFLYRWRAVCRDHLRLHEPGFCLFP